MVTRASLCFLLVALAAGQYTEPAPSTTPAPLEDVAAVTDSAPAVEVVEDAAPAAEAAEAPAPEAGEAGEAAPETEDVAEAAVEAPAEEPVYTAAPPRHREEVKEEQPATDYSLQKPYQYHPSYGYETSYGHHQPSYGHHQPSYGHHQPSYGHHQPSHGHHQPSYGHQPAVEEEHEDPACSKNTTKDWCLEDSDYPSYQITHAVSYHHYAFLTLYQDVVANTSNSVDRLEKLEDETYLCSSETGYVQPLRAKNTDGKWRIIVNNIKVHYDTYTQSTRVEECLKSGEPCPLVPHCYESVCHQKSSYHRFLIYDPSDYYFPFAIETFKLPSACSCFLGAYTISH